MAPSVVSDNRGGARDLARLLLNRCDAAFGPTDPRLFIGGRATDHNTAARIDGFLDAHSELGIDVPESLALACGYAGEKAQAALEAFEGPLPSGIFVNSTITLEGVIRWLTARGRLIDGSIRFGCFGWDPFAALLPGNVGMVQQDVGAMLDRIFDLLDEDHPAWETTLVPCLIDRLS